MSENEEQPTQSAVESPVGSAAPANAEGLADATPKKKRRPRRKPSKRHCSNRDNVDRNKRYDFAEAVALLKRVRPIKFDETIELAVKLGIDSKQSDQQVRGTVILPRGTGKKVTVLVFAEGDKAEEARAAGADFVGSADLATRILKEGWVDFDIALATPDMMKIVGPLGRVLGPHGKMPSPKGGTLTADIGRRSRNSRAVKSNTGMISKAIFVARLASSLSVKAISLPI